MNDIKLLESINPLDFKDGSEIIDHMYGMLKNNFYDNNKRPRLYGNFIYVDYRKGFFESKPERFWHKISFEHDEKFAVYPCDGEIEYKACYQEKSHIINVPDEILQMNRKGCLFRTTKAHWVINLINMANENNPHIRSWLFKESGRKDKRGKRKDRYIRYIQYRKNDFDTSFVLVLAEQQKKGKTSYYYISSYPVTVGEKYWHLDKKYRNRTKK